MNSQPVYLARDWSSINSKCVENVNGVEVATLKGFECVFANILNVIVRLAGIAFFIMLLVGGIKLMTAGGDAKKTQSAQQTLTYSIIGLVAIIGSWFVLQLIKVFTGVDVTIFTIFTQ